MTNSTPEPAAPARRRSLVLVVLDITVGVIVILFGIVLALGVIVTALSFANLQVTDETLRSTIINVMIAVVIFGWAITSGMFVIRAIQRRYAFYWPIIGIIIIVLSFYLGALVVGPLGVDA